MTRNQLPEGVGKKIVEALKRQAEADITPISNEEANISNNVPLTQIDNIEEVAYEPLASEAANDNIIVEEEPANLAYGVYQMKEEVSNKEIIQPIQPEIVQVQQEPITYTEPVNVTPQASYNFSQVSVPPNVAILKNLITSLPAGVTKQTGAQIIRQTLEAMGLPMTSVLKEAQTVQDELKSSTRECMLKIQEYKTQILQLEASVQEYQKNIAQINDLISLFLLTENK